MLWKRPIGAPLSKGTQTTAVIFGIASFTGLYSTTFPGAATNFDTIFLDAANAITVSPFLRSTHQSSSPFSGVVIPSAGFDVDWLYWDVPANSALIGQAVTMQALRLDSNSYWYVSDHHITVIVQ